MPDGKHLIPALEQQLETGIFLFNLPPLYKTLKKW